MCAESLLYRKTSFSSDKSVQFVTPRLELTGNLAIWHIDNIDFSSHSFILTLTKRCTVARPMMIHTYLFCACACVYCLFTPFHMMIWFDITSLRSTKQFFFFTVANTPSNHQVKFDFRYSRPQNSPKKKTDNYNICVPWADCTTHNSINEYIIIDSRIRWVF